MQGELNAESDDTKPSRRQDTGKAKAKEQAAPKGFVKPPGFDGLPAPIRQRGQQPKHVKREEEEESLPSDSDSDGKDEDHDLQEDAGFLDDFIESARQKRKIPIQANDSNSAPSLNAPSASKKKKVKQETRL